MAVEGDGGMVCIATVIDGSDAEHQYGLVPHATQECVVFKGVSVVIIVRDVVGAVVGLRARFASGIVVAATDFCERLVGEVVLGVLCHVVLLGDVLQEDALVAERVAAIRRGDAVGVDLLNY